MDLKQLTTRFASDAIRFRIAGDNLVLLDISNAQANATICLQGAQLLQWTPADTWPVLWLSEQAVYRQGKAIRGGVPVCWPWFGDNPDNPDLPAHGFARNVLWQLQSVTAADNGPTQLLFELHTDASTLSLWPCRFGLRLHVSVGSSLEMTLETSNHEQSIMPVTEALHSYFNISDIGNIRIDGLDNSYYLDKTDGYSRQQQQGAVIVDNELDRIYLDTGADCAIEDSGFGRKILISKSGSASTVVWNPWQDKSMAMADMDAHAYRRMVCVESGNIADNRIMLAPGECHELRVQYRVVKHEQA